MKKMMNRPPRWILPAVLLCLSSPNLMAEDSSCSPFAGLYLGGAIGGSFNSAREYSTTDLSLNFSETTLRIPRTLQGSTQHSLQGTQRKNNFAVFLYTGYGCAWEDVYLGIEAFLKRTDYRKTHRATFNATESTNVSSITRLNASVQNTIAFSTRLAPTEPGIDLRPGYFLTPCTLLYGRLGVGYNTLTLHARTVSSATVIPPLLVGTPIVGTETASKHRKIGTLRLGLGLEQHLGECMSIRVDYINTQYRGTKIRTGGFSTTVPNLNNGTTQLSTQTIAHLRSFSNNSVTVGISYYW